MARFFPVEEEKKEMEQERASLIQNFFNERDQFFDIDPGVYDYVIKCIDGIYTGRFLHINQSSKKEVFGCSEEPASGVTVCIEGAGLSDNHCEVQLKEPYIYTLRDSNS